MSKSTLLIKIDSYNPDLSKLREVARGCREGKIVAFPTETVYGIGGPMSLSGLSENLARLKNRPLDKPFSYHIGDWDMIDFLGVCRTAAFRYLILRFWPGPLTLLVENRQGNKIGIRYPQHRITSALINTVGEPFVATSANVSGEPSPRKAEEVMHQFEGKVDYVIDAGLCEIGQDSTVVDLTGERATILRKGAIGDEIEEAVKRVNAGKIPRKRILLVCTGNSCRSPMAAGWLERQLEARQLEEQIEVISCGIGARGGLPPTPEAVMVMKNREIDIEEHRSRACTRELIMNADLIFAMGREHFNFISGLVPSARDRIQVLDIPDPIGMGVLLYEEIFNVIERKLKNHLNKIIA